MLTKFEKDLIHSIALDNMVRDDVVEDIILSIYHDVAKLIESADKSTGHYPNIGLIGMGKFVVTHKKKKFWNDYYDKRDKDTNGGETDSGEGAGESSTSDCVDQL